MRQIIIALLFLLPFTVSAQLLRSYGVVEIGSTFPASSTTGAKYAYRPVDSSFYRWVSGNTWVKVVNPSISPLYLKQTSGTTSKFSGDTINLVPYLLKTDTTSMLSSYVNLAGWGLSKLTKTLQVDSSKVATRFYVQNIFLAKTDTAAMLAKYIERGDTASMLTNYPSTAGYGIIDGGKTWRADTTSPNGLATRKYTILNPTAIANTRIAVSNGTNLVGNGNYTYDAATGIQTSIFSTGSILKMFTGVNNSGSPRIELGNQNSSAVAAVIQGTARGSFSNVHLDFLTTNVLRTRIQDVGTTNFYFPITVRDIGLTFGGNVNNSGTRGIYFNGGTNEPTAGNAGIFAVPEGSFARIDGFGLSINNTPSGSGYADATASTFALYVKSNKNILIGTTTDVPTSILTARSTTKASSPFPLHTLAQADAITGVQGNFDYETTQNGLRWHNGTRKAYALESTFARGTATYIPYFDANGQITQGTRLAYNSTTNSLLTNSINMDSGGASGTAPSYGIRYNNLAAIDIYSESNNVLRLSSRSETFSVIGGSFINSLTTGNHSGYIGVQTLSWSSGNANYRGFITRPTVNVSGTYSGRVTGFEIEYLGTGLSLSTMALEGIVNDDGNNRLNYTSGSTTIGVARTTTPQTSAILELESTTKGFLPTRWTAAQRTAISSPATGLLGYQTDATEGLYVKLSSAYKRLLVEGEGADGNGIYTGSGSLSGVTTVNAAANRFAIKGSADIFFKDTSAKTLVRFGDGGAGGYILLRKTVAGTSGAAIYLTDTISARQNFHYQYYDSRSTVGAQGSGNQVVQGWYQDVFGFREYYYNRVDTNYNTLRHLWGERGATKSAPQTYKWIAGVSDSDSSPMYEFTSDGLSGKLAFKINTSFYLRQNGKIYFGSDSTFRFDPATDLLQLSAYGTPATTAAALSKTLTNYGVGFATDGTVTSRLVTTYGLYAGSGTLANHTTRAKIPATGNLLFSQTYNTTDSAYIQVINNYDGNREVRGGLTDTTSTGYSTFRFYQDEADEEMGYDFRSLDNTGNTRVLAQGGNIRVIGSDIASMESTGEIRLLGLVTAKQESYSEVTSTTSPVTLSSDYSDNLINQGSTQATFTFKLPASPDDGQIAKITFFNAVTVLTIDGNGTTITGTLPTSAMAGTHIVFKNYSGIGWIRQL